MTVTPRGGEPERFDEVVLATHSDQALALLGRRDRPRARDPRRDPVPAQRGRPAHRPRAAAAPPARVGELELPPAPRADRDDDGHLPHEPPAGARRRPRVLRDAQPLGRDRSRRRSCARSPTRTPSSRPRARARRPATTRSAAATARTTRRVLALGLPRGRRRERACAWPSASGRACDDSAVYEGTIRHRRFAVREHGSATGSRSPTSTSTRCRRRSAAGSSRWPGLARFRRRDYLGDAGGPLADAVRGAGRRARPTDDPLLTMPRSLGSASTRSPSTTASTRGERATRRRGDQHALGRAPRLRRCRRRRRSDVEQGAARLAVHGHGPRLRRSARPRPGETLSVHIESRRDGELAFDATLQPAAPPVRRRGACSAPRCARCR